MFGLRVRSEMSIRRYGTFRFNSSNQGRTTLPVMHGVLCLKGMLLMEFRELMSPRGHALLELLAPVEHQNHLSDRWRSGRRSSLKHEEATVTRHIVEPVGSPSTVSALEQRMGDSG